MNPLYDLEVIDSAVLSGEIDDSMNLIVKQLEKVQHQYNLTKNEKWRSHSKVLLAIQEYLEGKSNINAVREILENNFVYDVDEKMAFIDNFTYHLFYSVDRYNVRFPQFNGKRCGDL
jgi:hypothetical protein